MQALDEVVVIGYGTQKKMDYLHLLQLYQLMTLESYLMDFKPDFKVLFLEYKLPMEESVSEV